MTDTAEQHATFEHRGGLLESLRVQLHQRALLSPLLVLILSFIVFSVIADNFPSDFAISTILAQIMVFGILAIGQTCVVLTSGVDLSVGATMSCSLMAMAKLSAEGKPDVLVLIIGFGIGVVCGLINGFFVTKLNLQPFIVTLGTLFCFTSLSLWYSKGASVRLLDVADNVKLMENTFSIRGQSYSYGILVMVLLFLVMSYSLRFTAWGRHVYAVGDDREAARLAGIRVNRVLLSVYLITGVFAAIAGWVLIGRSGGDAQAGLGSDYNLLSIVFVVVGGTSLFGGRGKVLGTLLGALIYRLFDFALPLSGVDSIWRNFAVGLLILAAVTIDQWVRKVAK